MRKKRDKNVCFSYKYAAQMTSNRTRKHLFTDGSTYRPTDRPIASKDPIMYNWSSIPAD